MSYDRDEKKAGNFLRSRISIFLKRTGTFLTANWKPILQEFLYTITIPTIFTIVASLLGIASIFAKSDVVKSLIQAEATLLGFFGIIVAYILKSLDDKENSYGERLLDLTSPIAVDVDPLHASILAVSRSIGKSTLEKLMSKIQSQKRS